MSLSTWKKEFYNPAATTIARKKDVTDIELIDACITKWTGALPANTAKHDVDYRPWSHLMVDLTNDDLDGFEFNASSCALCQKYDTSLGRPYADWSVSSCARCPLAKSRNGVPCCTKAKGERESPYRAKTPRPMINALNKARVWVLAQEKA